MTMRPIESGDEYKIEKKTVDHGTQRDSALYMV